MALSVVQNAEGWGVAEDNGTVVMRCTTEQLAVDITAAGNADNTLAGYELDVRVRPAEGWTQAFAFRATPPGPLGE